MKTKYDNNFWWLGWVQSVWKFAGNLGMGKKIFVLTLLTELLVVGGLGVTTYRIWTGSVVNQELTNAVERNSLAVQHMNDLMSNIQAQLIMLSENIALLQADNAAIQTLITKLHQSYESYVDAIYVLKRNSDVIGSPDFVLDIYKMRFIKPAYDRLIESNLLFYWSEPNFSPVFKQTMTGMRRIHGTADWNDAVLAADLNLRALVVSALDYQKEKSDELFLLGRSGRILAINKDGIIQNNIAESRFETMPALKELLADSQWNTQRYAAPDGHVYRLFRSGLYRFNLDVVTAVDESRINGSLRKLQRNFLYISAFGLLLCIGIAYIVMRNLARPIQLFIYKMSNDEGQMREMLNYVNRKDEIGHLARTYNSMLKRISQQMRMIKELETQKRTTEFKALQSQIRPHFLYNTLNAIKSSANIHGIPSMAHAIASLITLLRFTVDRQDELVPLGKELEHLQAYIRLMQFQYPEVSQIIWEIDESFFNVVVPKMILQPIVENAIYHGILPGSKPGVLILNGYIDNASTMILDISDNGVGFSEESLERFQEQKEGKEGKECNIENIGLVNVHRRLRLYFGEHHENAGLSIISQSGEGTTIRLTIPITLSVGERT